MNAQIFTLKDLLVEMESDIEDQPSHISALLLRGQKHLESGDYWAMYYCVRYAAILLDMANALVDEYKKVLAQLLQLISNETDEEMKKHEQEHAEKLLGKEAEFEDWFKRFPKLIESLTSPATKKKLGM